MTLVEWILRVGPAVVLAALCLWLFFATRRTSSRIGKSAYGFGVSSRQRASQTLFRASVAIALAATVAHAAGLDTIVTRPVFAPSPAIRLAGTVLAVLGAALAILAQSDMGRRWRVGIPTEAPDDLVTQGPFAVSRNPVFLGMMTTGVGIVIVLPSPLTLLCLAGFWIACEIQIRDEERFLEATFGDRYATYRSHVRRWI